MAINKVVYGDQTLIDLTGDTVEASNLLEGETAHTRSGSAVTGTAKQGHIIKDADGTAMTQRPAIKFADADVSDDSTNQQTVVEVMHDPMTLANFLDAQNLDDGIYPVTEDDNTVLSSDMISHGNGTVEQAIDGKVSKSGDTMSGALSVQKSGEAYVEVQNTNKSLAMALDVANDGKQGLWSNGYNDGTFHLSGKWIVNREANGDVSVNGTTIPSNGGTVALTSDIYNRQFLGTINEGQSISIPDGYHNIYLRCDINSYYYSPTYSTVIVPYLEIPFPIGDTWVGTERLTYDSGTKKLTYYSELTVFGSKPSTWTTNIMVWYD